MTDPDSDASGEDTETQDDSTQDNGSGDGSDNSTTEEDGDDDLSRFSHPGYFFLLLFAVILFLSVNCSLDFICKPAV